jgi:hypothetical protein
MQLPLLPLPRKAEGRTIIQLKGYSHESRQKNILPLIFKNLKTSSDLYLSYFPALSRYLVSCLWSEKDIAIT